jgi:hypothetical protein
MRRVLNRDESGFDVAVQTEGGGWLLVHAVRSSATEQWRARIAVEVDAETAAEAGPWPSWAVVSSR